MAFVSWKYQRVLCTTPPIASSRTRTAVKGESAREWTSTFILQAQNLHCLYSHTPQQYITIWALTFNHFNGYLISEPPSVEPTRGTHGELPNPLSFRPIKYIYHLVESCGREHGATFSSQICHSDLLFKTQSPPFSEQLNNPWYVENICQGAQ